MEPCLGESDQVQKTSHSAMGGFTGGGGGGLGVTPPTLESL
jgi:hypothetical protein